MQFVTISKATNIALLWFHQEDVADYLNVHPRTILYGRNTKGQYFHLKNHDIYVFNYKIESNSDNNIRERAGEAYIFKQAAKYQTENIAPAIKQLCNYISIAFLSVSFASSFDKKKTVEKTKKLISENKEILNKKKYAREFEILCVLNDMIEEYEE